MLGKLIILRADINNFNIDFKSILFCVFVQKQKVDIVS